MRRSHRILRPGFQQLLFDFASRNHRGWKWALAQSPRGRRLAQSPRLSRRTCRQMKAFAVDIRRPVVDSSQRRRAAGCLPVACWLLHASNAVCWCCGKVLSGLMLRPHHRNGAGPETPPPPYVKVRHIVYFVRKSVFVAFFE